MAKDRLRDRNRLPNIYWLLERAPRKRFMEITPMILRDLVIQLVIDRVAVNRRKENRPVTKKKGKGKRKVPRY